MKRILLLAALCAAVPLAQAQWRPGPDDEVTRLEIALERLQRDPLVAEYAARPLARAEDAIARLAALPSYRVQPEDVEEAERLLQRAERVALRRAERRVPEEVEREVVIIEDERDDPRPWRDAERARHEADRAHAEAEEERERALAARLEAEHERAANARLREELGEAQTRVTERGVVLTLGDVLFAVGKADLKPGATRTLDALVAALRRDEAMRVTIEGHTDSTGRRDFNLTLSERRAEAVRRYLAARGVAAERIDARGLGPDFPVATNATEAGRQQNRRVELLVQNDAFEE